MNPLTFKGHKFDVRLWALVTSLDPLRVYVLRKGVPKISQWTYSSSPAQTKEQCMHILLPGTDECYRSPRARVLRPYPPSTADEGFLAHLGRRAVHRSSPPAPDAFLHWLPSCTGCPPALVAFLR